LAERINGIIKNEFNLYSSNHGFDDTCLLIEKSIEAYNTIRPHSSCDYLTPSQAHYKNEVLKKRWKKYDRPKVMPGKTETAGPGAATTKSKPPGPVN
jgi:hypothetical protein